MSHEINRRFSLEIRRERFGRSDFGFRLEPVLDVMAIFPASSFIQLVGPAANLLHLFLERYTAIDSFRFMLCNSRHTTSPFQVTLEKPRL